MSEVVQADMVDMVEVEVGPLATETVGAHVTPVVAQQQRRFPRLLRVGGRRRAQHIPQVLVVVLGDEDQDCQGEAPFGDSSTSGLT